jgi:hypothetical protein
MRVGKSGLAQCDFCGKPIQGVADSLTKSGKTHHFCQGTCLKAYLREHFNDLIVHEVERLKRDEYNLLHKRVCAGCVSKLRNLL